MDLCHCLSCRDLLKLNDFSNNKRHERVMTNDVKLISDGIQIEMTFRQVTSRNYVECLSRSYQNES